MQDYQAFTNEMIIDGLLTALQWIVDLMLETGFLKIIIGIVILKIVLNIINKIGHAIKNIKDKRKSNKKKNFIILRISKA